MGRTKSTAPVSRTEYRAHAWWKKVMADKRAKDAADKGTPLPRSNAEGRARFAAKHAAAPQVVYLRTEQSNYTDPKTPPAPAAPRLRGRSIFAALHSFQLAALAGIRAKRRADNVATRAARPS
jgi:hypothetical protein